MLKSEAGTATDLILGTNFEMARGDGSLDSEDSCQDIILHSQIAI